MIIEGIYCIKVDGEVIYQQNHIGIPDKNEDSENLDKPTVIEL